MAYYTPEECGQRVPRRSVYTMYNNKDSTSKNTDKTARMIVMSMIALVIAVVGAGGILAFLVIVPRGCCSVVPQAYNGIVVNATANYVICKGATVPSERESRRPDVVTISVSVEGTYRVGEICPVTQVEQVAFSSDWTATIGQQCTPVIITMTVVLSVVDAFLVMAAGLLTVQLGFLLGRPRKEIYELATVTVKASTV